MEFAESMNALRNKNNPKSENLSEMVNTIVGDLESHFDTYDADKRGKQTLNLHTAKVRSCEERKRRATTMISKRVIWMR